MKNRKTKYQENEKGITLIALVITIIVLLILATISIATLTGENGVLTKANVAKTETVHATIKEEIILKKSNYELEKVDGYKGSFIEYLEKEKMLQDNSDGTYQIDVTKLIGEKQTIGNGTDTSDVYKLEKIDEEENYVVNYYDKNGEKTEILDLGNGSVGKGEIGSKPEQMEPTEIYAKVYSDGTTIFSSYDYVDSSHGEVEWTYSTEELNKIYRENPPPWLDVSTTGGLRGSYFDRIVIQDKIAPTYSNYWFLEVQSVIGIENLITNNLTDMSNTFYNCDAVELNLSNFDTSNVTNMNRMFSYCSPLEKLDLSSFDTSNVTNMSEMFSYCTHLEKLDLSSFDISEATKLDNIFDNCVNLKTVYVKNEEIGKLLKEHTSLDIAFVVK